MEESDVAARACEPPHFADRSWLIDRDAQRRAAVVRTDRLTIKNQPLNGLARTSCFAFGNVFAHDALVTFQAPLVVGAIGEPLGNTNLRVYLTGSHGDARLLTGGNDFLQAKLAVAENRDESNKHWDLH
jgi:hypothetical protein